MTGRFLLSLVFLLLFPDLIYRSFFLLVLMALHSQGATILSDSFSYADGSLVIGSDKWTTHSGTTGQVAVASGRAKLSDNLSEDVNALLAGEPYAPTSGVLYASCTIHFTNLPSASGEYFAHFKSSSPTGFRGKIFATRQGAAAGFFRIGLANVSNTPNVIYPAELALNTDYTMLTRCVLSNAQSTVWINPAQESDFNITDTNSTATLSITSFAFRQASGFGTLWVDDLLVGTNFSEVLRLRAPNLLNAPNRKQSIVSNALKPVTSALKNAGKWQRNNNELNHENN